MKLFLTLCLLAVYGSLIPVASQSLSGDWAGQLWQADAQDTFVYQIRLEQAGEAVTGTATSTSQDGSMSASFLLSGRWNGQQLQLQEVEQTQPSAPQWCLKYATLVVQGEGDQAHLVGDWTATGCSPGKITLYRSGIIVEELPFTPAGRWTGHLSQSDREYGFYFSVELAEDGTGTSSIVSEGAGGEATHSLVWYEEEDGIVCQESSVIKRTDPDWKWCLKTLDLHKQRKGDQYEMSGEWEGFLEHKDPLNGACAPGTVFLSKPVLTQVIEQEIAPQRDDYTTETGRSVKVDRVIQVQGDNIRIRVWDNGIVDGDVLTLFLNGERIISNHRVNKRRWSIPVNVIPGENLLILHAEDLGDISPNTVAVAIDDGVEEQVIILSSNLRESGAILIQPFEVN